MADLKASMDLEVTGDEHSHALVIAFATVTAGRRAGGEDPRCAGAAQRLVPTNAPAYWPTICACWAAMHSHSVTSSEVCLNRHGGSIAIAKTARRTAPCVRRAWGWPWSPPISRSIPTVRSILRSPSRCRRRGSSTATSPTASIRLRPCAGLMNRQPSSTSRAWHGCPSAQTCSPGRSSGISVPTSRRRRPTAGSCDRPRPLGRSDG